MRREKEELEALRLRVADLERALRRGCAFVGVEDCFRAAFESSGVAQSIKLLTGEITINRAFREMLGYSENDCPSSFWEGLTAPEDIEYSRNRLEALLGGESGAVRYIKRYIHKNGSYVWGDVSLTLRRNEEGEPLFFIATILDISERRRAEEALRESEARLKLFIEHAPAALAMFDRQLRYLAVSRRWMNDYELGERDIIGVSDYEVFPEIDEKWKEIHRRALSGEVVKGDDDPFERADGRVQWLRWEARPWYAGSSEIQGIVVFTEDISAVKHAEFMQQESEAKFRSIVENAPDAIFIQTEGKFAYLNPAACRLFGASSQEELLGTPVLEHVDPLFHDAVRGRIRRLNEDRQPVRDSMEQLMLRTDMSGVWVETTGEPFLYKGKTGALVFVRDITWRKEAQASLRESEERFRCIFEENLSVMFIVDPSTGRFLDVNKACVAFYGWSREELLRMRSQDINLLGESSLREIQKAAAGEHSYFEFRHRLADGGIRDVEVFTSRISAGEKPILFCIVNDITSRKSAQRQVRLLGRAVEQNSGSIIITDAEQRIEYVNPAFSLSTGYSADEVTGRHVRALRSEEHGELFHEDVWKTLLSGRTWRGEVRSRKKSGELFWENVVISPIHDEGMSISHFIAIKDDITEKKQLIESLVRAKERAEESDRLKTAFLQNMSHEIRTPMNGILGFLGLLDEPALDEDERSEYIRIVNFSGQRLLNTINDIIEISRIESGEVSLHIEEVDVEQMMRYHRDLFSLQAQEKGIGLTPAEYLVGDAAIIRTDKNKLYSTLSNLLGNAVKFTCKGGVEFGNRLEGQNLIFYVKDTGIGIPEHRLGAVFERFMQADQSSTRPYEGSGLGLTIAKANVEALGGRIRVVSEEGKGSVFSFSIPYIRIS